MGEVVPARTSPTLHPPIPSHYASIVVTSTLRVNLPIVNCYTHTAACCPMGYTYSNIIILIICQYPYVSNIYPR